MEYSIRKWRMEDARDLANALNNKNILNNLRDGLPYPYTEKDAKEYIMAMLESSADKTFAFAITAVKMVCKYIFEKTDIIRIFAEPFAYNIASCRVLEKSGFEYEGTLRKNAVKNGVVLDMKMYALVKIL